MLCKPFTLTTSIRRQREHINGPTTTTSHPSMALRGLLVDVHTHLYLPRYVSVLRSRSTAPRILTRNTPSGQSEDRLLILDNEPSGGRPVGPQVRRNTLSYLKDRGG
jgi:hypothetical protein